MGLLLKSPTGEQLKQPIWLGFPTSNNEVEFEVILFGLDLTFALSASKLKIYSDSQLIMEHIQKKYEAKNERMSQYLMKVRDSLKQLDEWVIKKIPWADNISADALVGIVASLPMREAILLLIHVQATPSIVGLPVYSAIEES